MMKVSQSITARYTGCSRRSLLHEIQRLQEANAKLQQRIANQRAAYRRFVIAVKAALATKGGG